MEQMHEITFGKLSDGTIQLEQSCGLEEPSMIHLHPEQLRFITRRVCGMSTTTAEQVEDLERKLSVLTDRLERLVTDDWFRKGIIEECGDGIEMIAKLDGLVDLAIEMDGGRLLPNEPPEPKKKGSFQPMKPPATLPDKAVPQRAPQTDKDAEHNVMAQFPL